MHPELSRWTRSLAKPWRRWWPGAAAAVPARHQPPAEWQLPRAMPLPELQRRFAADLAHELRTPLTALTLIGENELARAPADSRPRETIASMLEECKRMRRLIDGLLLLARASEAGATIAREPVDVTELACECLRSLSVLAEEKRQTLSLAPTPPHVALADPVLLRQALLNIVHNAVSHCPRGARIEVAVGSDAPGAVFIAVRDNGPGIPHEQQSAVFERFQRCGKRPDRSGSGLGLAIARAVLEAHGGQLRLRSAAGLGTCFTLVLPAEAAPAAVDAAPLVHRLAA